MASPKKTKNTVIEEPVVEEPKGRTFNLPGEGSLIWEILGTVTGLFGLFLLVSLVIGPEGQALVGVGALLAEFLQVLLGRFVSFLVPASVFIFAFQLFRARLTRISPSPMIGSVLLIMAITGLIALPYADVIDKEIEKLAVQNAGIVGSSMVNWDGLRLYDIFGSIGASMILVCLGLIGIVLITNKKVSVLFQLAYGAFRRESAGGAAVLGPPVDFPEPVEENPKKKSRLEKMMDDTPVEEPPFTGVDGNEEEDVPMEAREGKGFFGWFGRKKEPLLADPDPQEDEDPVGDYLDDLETYDADALAAARALEEARIDEEYERALCEEEERLARGEELDIDEYGDDDELENKDIVFQDCTNPLDVISGNPANEDQLADGLAKLFPNRWEKEGEELVRKDPNKKEKTDEEIRDAAEDRAFRQADMGLFDEAEQEVIDFQGDDDPLFSGELDTRPAGPLAAQEAATHSALELDSKIAERNRQLAEYKLPDIQILEDPPKVDHRMSRDEMLEMSQMLEQTFTDFSIKVKVVEVKQGPVVTRFELKPAPGVKVSRITSLEHDIALAMKAQSVRIVAPIPGKAAVGIEIPNKKRSGVYVKELVSCSEFWDHPSPLGLALGKTIDGQPYFADLKKMPHLLIAGATGAGKSVCLNTIICSFLYRMRPDRLRLLMIDPKRVELSVYGNIPHLLSPVVCEPKCAAAALQWAVEEMENRYKRLVAFNVRNIDGYNDIVLSPEKQLRHKGKKLDYMAHIVIVVDEFADLMVVAKGEVEESIQRLAQMARAVGIHLILATQRPSVNVITGIIKANFPTRIAFQVSQKVDSRTIIDANGAEGLLGRGDMLYAPAGAQKPIRIQGAFLSDEEVEKITDHCREQADPMYEVEEFQPLLSEKEQREIAKMMGGSMESMDDLDLQDRILHGTNRTMGKVTAGMFVPHEGGSANAGEDEIDEALVRAAARLVFEARRGSTSLLQRRLKVGFARAGRLMDMLENMGVVGPYQGSKPRDLMVDCDLALEQLDALEQQIQQTGSSRAAAQALDGVEPENEE